jgi:hypothetical protein
MEITVDGEAEPVTVKLGVWLSNTKSRRDKLTAERRAALAALGMESASPAPTPEAAPEPPAVQSAPPTAPAKRAVREHHEECDKELMEIAVDGQAEPVSVRLGVWVSNTRARRDKLTGEQLQALRELGMQWA